MDKRVCLSVLAVLGFQLLAASACPAEPLARPRAVVYPLLAPRLTSDFGMRKHPIRKVRRNHTGVDLAAPIGSHVRAVASGEVVFADTYAGYGKLVTIRHEGECTSLYGHLSETTVNPGDAVRPGQIIGRVGDSGESTGPHLHFEWRVDGKPVDPVNALPGLFEPPEG